MDGKTGSATGLARMDVYDPATDTWSAAASLPTPREQLAVTVVGDKLYAAGGFVRQSDGHVRRMGTVEVYDAATDRWNSLPSLSVPRNALTLVAVGRTLYAFGGNDGKGFTVAVEALTLP